MTFDKITVKLKIIIATYQVIVAAATVLDVQVMPSAYSRFTRALSFVNLDIMQLFNMGCAMSMGYINRLLWTTLVPIGLCFVLLLNFVIERWSIYFFHSDRSDLNEQRELVEDLTARTINYLFYLSYLILPSVTTTIFQLFVCKDADPANEDRNNHDRYLAADVNISCDSPYYQSWKLYGYLMTLVYPIGITFFYWYCLYSYRKEIKHRSLFEHPESPTDTDPNDIESIAAIPAKGSHDSVDALMHDIRRINSSELAGISCFSLDSLQSNNIPTNTIKEQKRKRKSYDESKSAMKSC